MRRLKRKLVSLTQQLYKIKTITDLTGFSPTLLRAWERRYDLLEPQRTASTHRLYTQDDLQVLLRVRDLLAGGRSIGEIAAMGRQHLLSERSSPSPESRLLDHAPELQRIAEGMVEAALELDEIELTRLFDRGLATVSFPEAVQHIILPATTRIGELWARQEASIAAEHLLTSVLGRRINHLIDAEVRNVQATRRAICACFPDELHELGCMLVTLQLLRLGFNVTYLGASLPLEDLERTVAARRPEFVFLSVSRPAILELHRPRLLELLRRHAKSTIFVLGGEGVKAYDQAHLLAAGIHLWPAGRPIRELDVSLFVSSQNAHA